MVHNQLITVLFQRFCSEMFDIYNESHMMSSDSFLVVPFLIFY